jgi:aminotransferase
MSAIIDYCKNKNIYLIEDNACSVASVYNGQHCGTLGDFGIFSFDSMKILVMGDGGLIYAKQDIHINKIEKMAYLGLESVSGLSNFVHDKWWEFEISCFGNRQIINDVSAAIGIEQLKKLDLFIEQRKKIHEIYNSELGNIDWIRLPPQIPHNIKSSYYFYWIQTKYRNELAKYLRKNDIYTTFRYYPLHKVSYYQCHEKFPNAEIASNETLCLPIHQSLSDKDMQKIIESIKNFKK